MGNLTHTVSGDIASFRTPSRVPIESLKFHFLPKQEGSGDPSPTNVRPITGWTGLNGKRSGKNLAHVVGYSATSVSSSSAQRQTENSYGTTISTVNYISPDTALVVTQASTGSPDSPSSYKNGYFEVVVDNLELDKYYDVSFKITNVLSNPLNVSLEDIKMQPPSGSSWPVSEVKNGNILIFRNKKFAVGNGPDRKTFTVRSCGMSFTISEFMVTPTNTSDGVFEPYSGEQIPITFPILTKNLFNPNCPMLGHSTYTINSDKITQNSSDGRGWLNDNFPPYKLPAGTYTISCSDGGAINFRTSADGYDANTRFDNGVGTFTIGNNESIKFKHTSTSYPVTFTIQIESGNKKTDYEPYLPSGMYLGGYYDPIVGEIVCSWRKFKLKEYEWTYKSGNHRFQMQLGSYEKANAPFSGWTNFAISDSYKQSNYAGYVNLMIASYADNYIYIRDDSYEDADDFVEAMGEAEIAYELANPIHIPITPQDLQAFLDYNNFWSDANDITEATYLVTESKDIAAVRKRFAAEENGHHKICEWNQLQIDGNFTDVSKWEVGNDYGTLAMSNNIATWTCARQPTQFYQTGFRIKNGTNNSNFLHIPWNHKVLVRGYVRCSISSRIRIYGLIGSNGNTYIYNYNYGNANLPANEWTKLFGFISDRPETPPSSAEDTVIKRFKTTLVGTSGTISTVVVGTTLEMKNFMVFDLTQMFGLGKEPSTVAEFERICQINGIDLDTYQPYDEGSYRWLIIP